MSGLIHGVLFCPPLGSFFGRPSCCVRWSTRAKKDGTKMPAIDGKTVGMTRENCMAYCFNRSSSFKLFGEQNKVCFAFGVIFI